MPLYGLTEPYNLLPRGLKRVVFFQIHNYEEHNFKPIYLNFFFWL